ncbi:nickel pincer cofactor biosynthesis protein LarC [Actinocorallia libanotica]|uniref:Pyridinium-3,5-bisthiocarboxylic acid mononucleotide nickel insertion protein n=1 Tax=Actinocorallia libanotica TaxID=46162 RepID=A0ABN1RJ41_9ACTN
MSRSAWVDASGGVAGDMLLAALLDAGASLEAVRAAVEEVIPGEVRIVPEQVTRAGLRALRVRVLSAADDHPHRAWPGLRALLTGAGLPGQVRDRVLSVFTRLAEAEARVHGVPIEEVHFHEVGSWDSIADVVGVCSALHDLAVTDLAAGPVALGSGRVSTAHGLLPVPVPAVAELAAGRRVLAGGEGELATPTGMALLTALARERPRLPPMRLERTGVGAGSRDTPGRPNTVRVFLGGPAEEAEALVLETNVDDLDPRAWPDVLASLLREGALDAWLVPILMKKGRPAHTLCVLAPPARAEALRAEVFRSTSTLGIRERRVGRTVLDRGWTDADVLGTRLPIKIGHRGGVIVQATPEYGHAARLAAAGGLPLRAVLAAAAAAAHAAGLLPGAPVPRLAPDPPA